jgi:hypothetical protein
MAEYTKHGQYIPGTGAKDPETEPEISEGCEGRFRCAQCAGEINDARFNNKAFARYYRDSDGSK